MSVESIRLLAKLANYPVRKWFDVAIKALALDVTNLLALQATERDNVVLSGFLTAIEGTTVTALLLDTTTTGAVLCKLNGVLKASVAVVSDASLVATAGAVAQAIYADGATAVGIDLTAASGNIAQVTLIIADTDGAGGATGDGGAALYVAVVAGTAATFETVLAPLTDEEITAALALSAAVHDGTTGWARLTDIVWDEGTSSPTAVYTINRDA